MWKVVGEDFLLSSMENLKKRGTKKLCHYFVVSIYMKEAIEVL